MKNITAIFNECMSEAKAIGIQAGKIVSVTVNTRAKKRWGRTVYEGNGLYTIDISDRLLAEDVDIMAAKNTMMHEILHTCKGCMNHGIEWKAMADKVNEAYPQYNIKRTTSADEKGVEATPPRANRYELSCVRCGRTWRYKRAPKYDVSSYRCSCGGSIKMKSLVPNIDILHL